MRLLIGVFGVLAAIWCGYWVFAARTAESAGEAWFEERRAEGWAAEYGMFDVSGFPVQFNTVLTDVTLADPDTGVVWAAPRFDATAAAYNPGKITVDFPETQTLSSPFATMTITQETMRAMAQFTGTTLALDNGTAELAEVTLRSTSGWDVTLESGALGVSSTQDVANSYELSFEAANLRPSDALRLGVDPQSRLPDVFDTFKLDATIGFDAPWDRFAIERARPQPRRIELRNFNARWGQLELRAVGELAVDSRGVPDGRITIKATNWREIIALGEALGSIPPSMVKTLEQALGLLARLSGPANTIDVPVIFSGGLMRAGPFPIGSAPTLSLR